MSGDGQAVVFAIDDTLFALPVASVREILDVRPAFRVPSAPAWLVGLIDVHGRSMPVIDLRRFGQGGAVEAGPGARFLIVDLEKGAADRDPRGFGLLVDAVIDVASHAANAIEPVPAIVPQDGPWRLTGVFRRGDRFVGLLDLTDISALADGAFAPDVCRALAA